MTNPSYNCKAFHHHLACAATVFWSPPPFKQLEAARNAAIAFGAPFEYQPLIDRYNDVLVHPGGRKHGYNQNGTFCSWVIECSGAQIHIADFNTTPLSPPNVFLVVPGESCRTRGIVAVVALFKQLVSLLGGTIRSVVVSRIDLAADIDNCSIDDFFAAVKQNRFVGRTKPTIIDSADGTTVWAKSKPVQCRVYQEAKREGGSVRIEFQMRTPFLRKHGVDTPESYLQKEAAIATYLTKKRFRFTAKPIDRQNRNYARAGVMPAWAALSLFLPNWASRPDSSYDISPLPPKTADIAHDERTVVGHLRRIARRRGLGPEDDPNVLLLAATDAINKFARTGKSIVHRPHAGAKDAEATT